MNAAYAIRIGRNSSFYYNPSPELKSCVEHYIHLHFSSNNLNEDFIHPFPKGEAELYFHVGDNKILIRKNGKEKYSKHFIIGPFDQPDCLYLKPVCNSSFYNCIIVPIKLSSLCDFIDIPLIALKNTNLDVVEIWGKEASHLKKQINDNQDVIESIKHIDIFLVKQLARKNNSSKRFGYLFEYCIRKEGNLTVEDLARETNISYRTIHRIFTEKLGICPKEYLRIVRFNKVCSLLKKYPFINWTELALSCGYYDQSHFIHEFKNFMKVCPEEFITRLKNNYYDAHPVAFSL